VIVIANCVGIISKLSKLCIVYITPSDDTNAAWFLLPHYDVTMSYFSYYDVTMVYFRTMTSPSRLIATISPSTIFISTFRAALRGFVLPCAPFNVPTTIDPSSLFSLSANSNRPGSSGLHLSTV